MVLEGDGVGEAVYLLDEDAVIFAVVLGTAEALAIEEVWEFDEFVVAEGEDAVVALSGGEADVAPDLATFNVEDEVVVVL